MAPIWIFCIIACVIVFTIALVRSNHKDAERRHKEMMDELKRQKKDDD